MSQQRTIYLLIFIIGLLLGVLFMMWLQTDRSSAEVKFTEIQRSVSLENSDKEMPILPFRSISKQVLPTVVFVEASVPVRRMNLPKDGNHEFDDSMWDKFLPGKRAQTVGSGVIISKDGYILTNNHVVDRADKSSIRVGLNDKRYYEASLIGQDPSTDIAVLKINGIDFPHALIGNSDDLEVGDWVLAVGNPFRLRSTVTAGIISALGRDVDIIDDRMRIENFIQTDAAINRGNSGGALVNGFGELVGINTAIATNSGTYEGYGFAIPINMGIKIARDIIEFGKVQRPYLGVQIASVTMERAQKVKLPEVTGVEIVDVIRDGSADKAGILPGDIILSLNNKKVDAHNQLQAGVALMRPGDVIALDVWRNKSRLTIEVTLVAMTDAIWNLSESSLTVPQQDENTGVALQSYALGIGVMALAKPENLSTFDLLVHTIKKDSQAEKNGLKVGDRILKIEQIKVETLKELSYQLEKRQATKRAFQLSVERDGTEVDLVINP